MKANYHTHTARCGHASGSDRDYVEAALQGGFQILGFTDHTPFFPLTDLFSSVRMPLQRAEEYTASLAALREEYADRIEIHIGAEAEFFPDLFEDYKKLLKKWGVEYLILGEHFLRWGDNPALAIGGACTEDAALFRRFIDLEIAAMETECYTYVAHPDVLCFMGQEEIFQTEARRLCERAKALGIPLEYNLLGYTEKRHYPTDRFYRIAADVGNDIMLGCDAHRPAVLTEVEKQAEAIAHVRSLGCHIVDSVPLRPIR